MSAWATLEDDAQSSAEGLPNRQCPSDHLPIAATFAPVAAPNLDGSAAMALVAGAARLVAAQPRWSRSP